MTLTTRALLAPGRRSWLTAGAALAALVGLVFRDLLRGRVPYERDIVDLYWGLAESFARTVGAGSLPAWNPWLGFGQPLLANPAMQVFYPLSWVNLVLRPESAYAIYAVFHLLLAALGLLALARALGLGPAAATTAAATWTLSGPLLSYVSLWHHFAGVAWMPWVLLAEVRALRTPTTLRTLGWGLAAAIQVLAGSIDAVLMTAVVEGLLVVRALDWHAPFGVDGRRRLTGLVAAASFALGLTAVVWLPAAALVAGSARPALAEGTRAFWSLRPVSLVQWLLPLQPQDLPLRPEVRQYLYQGREPFLASHNLGLAALALALAAFCGRHRREATGLAALVVLSALLALGNHGPVYPVALALFPPLRLLRYPPKVAILGAFAFALLVGYGLEAWRTRAKGDGSRFGRRVGVPTLAVVAAGTAALAIAWSGASNWLEPGSSVALAPVAAPAFVSLVLALGAGLAALSRLRPAAGASLAVASALIDLLQAHGALVSTGARAYFTQTPQVVSLLREDRASRVYGFDYTTRALAAPERTLAEPAQLRNQPWAWRQAVYAQEYPRSLLRWSISGSFGADPFSLEIPQERSLWLLLVDAEQRPADQLRLLQLGGVSHVIALHREGLERLAALTRVTTSHGLDVGVYRVPGSLPRAFLTSGVRVAAGVAAYGALLDPSFDARREVLLPEGEARSPRPGFHWELRGVEAGPDRLRLRARLDAPGHLVVLDGYDPSWHARVDGLEQPLLRANAAFRAVALESGEHDVELVCWPRGLTTGLLLLATTALVAVLIGGAALRRGPLSAPAERR